MSKNLELAYKLPEIHYQEEVSFDVNHQAQTVPELFIDTTLGPIAPLRQYTHRHDTTDMLALARLVQAVYLGKGRSRQIGDFDSPFRKSLVDALFQFSGKAIAGAIDRKFINLTERSLSYVPYGTYDALHLRYALDHPDGYFGNTFSYREIGDQLIPPVDVVTAIKRVEGGLNILRHPRINMPLSEYIESIREK